ncbi:hypothetical protein LEM8419_01401 [Neolewinella maritima]|uniref:5'-Nucleotidase C-terminal domain-containing protein n=1 Tax=Neolewinella maritima TaxID=1383882 RepID=A0ABN8F7G4_9BACT|nr:5'-nucleotidase [Neolewinella maritima]CAH1000252.1 hypothetical protein LEM8419_01401 [Neolewinella maritima]
MFRTAHAALALTLCCTLVSCNRSLGPPTVQPQFYPITQVTDTPATEAGRAVAATISPYSAQLTDQMNRELAEVGSPLRKGQPESGLGNWVADLLSEAATDLFPDYPIAFAVQNYGGLRVSEIGTGPLLVSEIYELMPFDNELVLVEVDGATLLSFVDLMIRDGGWPVSAGLSVQRQDEQLTVLVHNKEIEPTAAYFIAAPDYVANGGNDAAMLVDRPQVASARMVRDLLIEYAAQATTPITVVSDGSRFKLQP